jgi:hypothetical protein
LKLLDSSREFYAFCLERWRSRSLLDELLGLLKQPEELATMTRSQKINAVYQCAADDEYRDVTIQQEAHDDFLRATSHTRQPRGEFSISWKQSIAQFKLKLATNAIYSLPSAMFDMALRANEEELPADSCPWSATLGLATDAVPAFRWSAVDETVFFEVVTASPEKRKGLVAQHLDPAADICHIVRRMVTSWSEAEGSVHLLNRRGAHEALYLRGWAARPRGAWGYLFRWLDVEHATRQAVRHLPDAPPLALCDVPVLVPRASDVLAAPCPDRATMGARPESALAVLAPTDDVVAACLDQIRGGADLDGDGWISRPSLQNVETVTLEGLVAAGAVEAKTTEFGELVLRSIPGRLAFIGAMAVSTPRHVLTYGSCAPDSKLDVALALIRSGFAECDTLAPYTAGSAKLFDCAAGRPLSYFVCLYMAEDLWLKGVAKIPHVWPDVQYQCLLRLRGEKLAEFLARVEEGIDKAAARAFVRGAAGDGPVDAPALEPDPDSPEPLEDDGLGGVAAPPLPLLPHRLPSDALEWRRCLASVPTEGLSVKVYFDHCTSSSGVQRGWVDCDVRAHGRCFKWQQCSSHRCREDFVAFMTRWAADGRDASITSREDHMGHNPAAESVAVMKRTLITRDF